MKRHKYIIGILILSSLSFLGCKKKLFRHVELHGRVLNYITKAPEQANIWLSCNGRPGTNYNYDVGSATTYGDGTFYLRAQSYRYSPYYLDVSKGGGEPIEIKPDLKDGQNVNVGDFYMGSFTFFCKVTLVPVTTSAIDICNLHFNAGTSAQFMTNQKKEYNNNPDNFVISFRTYPGGVSTYSTVTVPTNSSPDTLAVTINY